MSRIAVVAFGTALCAALFMKVLLAECPHTKAVGDLCPAGETTCEELEPTECSGTRNQGMWGTFGCDASFYWEETQCADSLCDIAPCYHEAQCVPVTVIGPEPWQWHVECHFLGPYSDPTYVSIKETYDC